MWVFVRNKIERNLNGCISHRLRDVHTKMYILLFNRHTVCPCCNRI